MSLRPSVGLSGLLAPRLFRGGDFVPVIKLLFGVKGSKSRRMLTGEPEVAHVRFVTL